MTTATKPAATTARSDRRTVATALTWGAVAIAVATAIAAAVRVWSESPPAFMDLDVYRLGVLAWWHGDDLYGRLPNTIAHNNLPFIYPPFAVLFLGPLTVLPWPIAAGCMLGISLLALTGVIVLSVRNVWPTATPRTVTCVSAGFLVLSLVLLEPVQDTLWFGQINLLLMSLVALDCLPARTRWPRGLLVGIAAAVKLTPAVFLLYFLLRKDYRAAVTAAVSAAAATAIGFAVNWHGSLEFWFGSSGGARSVGGSPNFQNQTVAGFLGRLTIPSTTRTVLWLSVVAIVFVVAVIGIRRAHRWEHRTLAMSVTGCFGLIASPTSWGHHWVYVVPGVIAITGHVVQRRRIGWTIALLVTLATFAVGAYRLVPHRPHAYLHWTWQQQILGNTYIIVGIGLLVTFALGVTPQWRVRGAERRARRPSPPASSDPAAESLQGSATTHR